MDKEMSTGSILLVLLYAFTVTSFLGWTLIKTINGPTDDSIDTEQTQIIEQNNQNFDYWQWWNLNRNSTKAK